jgi:hypothetical protein
MIYRGVGLHGNFTDIVALIGRNIFSYRHGQQQ